jgi:NAD(P)H-dependent FMN reductase
VNIIVISCSLHPQSRSFVLARDMMANLQNLDVDARLYDLRNYQLPFCDDGPAYDHPHSLEITQAIASAQTVLLGLPVYNFDVNAAAKNLLELAGDAWNNKLVGFLCMVIPRFVYAVGADFGDDRLPTMHVTSQTIRERLQQLAQATVALTRALDGITVP